MHGLCRLGIERGITGSTEMRAVIWPLSLGVKEFEKVGEGGICYQEAIIQNIDWVK